MATGTLADATTAEQGRARSQVRLPFGTMQEVMASYTTDGKQAYAVLHAWGTADEPVAYQVPVVLPPTVKCVVYREAGGKVVASPVACPQATPEAQ